jgi:hypothetical protein
MSPMAHQYVAKMLESLQQATQNLFTIHLFMATDQPDPTSLCGQGLINDPESQDLFAQNHYQVNSGWLNSWFHQHNYDVEWKWSDAVPESPSQGCHLWLVDL